MWTLKVFALCALFLSTGCQVHHIPDPELLVAGCGLRNLTDYPIENVELKLLETSGVVSCSYIAEQGFFGTKVPQTVHREMPGIVTWTFKGKSLSSGVFVAPMPDPIPNEQVVAVVYFHPEGTNSFSFVPLSEIPARFR